MGWIANLIGRSAEAVVYWAPLPVDSHGRPVYASAVEISARWQDGVRLFVNMKGENQAGKATIFPVSQDLVVKGWVWRGSLTSIPTADLKRPYNVSGASEILAWEKIPDISKRDYLRKAIV